MKSILLSRTDRIGDVILTTSAFGPLRERFPGARIRALVRPEMVPLLSADRRIEAVSCPPGRGAEGIHPVRVREWARILRAFDADAAVFLHPDNDLQAAAALAGIRRRIGYRKQLGRFALTETIPYRRHLGRKHEALCNFDLLERIGCPAPADPRPTIRVPSGVELPDGVTPPYAVLHPDAFGGKPRWPAESFARLAAALHAGKGWRIVLVGGEAHPGLAKHLARSGLPPGAWTDRGGLDDLSTTAAVLAGAEAVVSRDSGPAHLAAAVGAPLVCLMGQCDPIHSPARWAPIGPRVRTLASDLAALRGESRQERWRRCFAAITPEQVLAAIEELRAG